MTIGDSIHIHGDSLARNLQKTGQSHGHAPGPTDSFAPSATDDDFDLKRAAEFFAKDYTAHCDFVEQWKAPLYEKNDGYNIAHEIDNEDTLFTGSNIACAVNAKTGEILWKSQMGDTGFTPAVLMGNTVVFGMMDDKGEVEGLCVFDKDSGALRWKGGDNVHMPAFSSPVFSPDGLVIYAPDSSGKIAGFHSHTGEKLKELPLPLSSQHSGSALFLAMDKDGTLFTGMMEPKIVALESSTGKVKWEFKTGLDSKSTYHTPEIGDTMVYCMTDNGKVYAVDKQTGKEQWHYDEMGEDTVMHLCEGKLYLTGTYGQFVCVDAATGKQLWKDQFKHRVSSPPVPARDGLLVIGVEMEGKVIALQESTGKRVGEIRISSPAYGKIVSANDGKSVLVPSADGNLYSLSLETMEETMKKDFEKFKKEGNAKDQGKPTVEEEDDVVIIGGVMLPKNRG